jgi:hypothetical protein
MAIAGAPAPLTFLLDPSQVLLQTAFGLGQQCGLAAGR